MTDRELLENEEVEVVHLELEDGEQLDCEVLDVIEVEGKDYIILLPQGEEDVFIYKYIEHEDDTFSLEVIEDDEEFEKVNEAFDKWAEEMDEAECNHDHESCGCGCGH